MLTSKKKKNSKLATVARQECKQCEKKFKNYSWQMQMAFHIDHQSCETSRKAQI